ncbi:MAG: SpaH/EbpB family LPXTG-anchored major pilin [Corynebacterium sp.]|nr:SpaH/EbpB family LPXTG-anchored major pilin [Corynebacterium sp.]
MRKQHGRVAITVILVLLSSLLAMPAHASNIDPDARGSLSITKHAGDPLTQFGDPSNPNADTNRDPISGIEFTIQRIGGIDLSTNPGWQELQHIDISDFYAGGSRAHNLEQGQSATTDTDGVAHFPNLELGAYYVTETTASAQRQGTTVARPFVVTVPATNAERTQWDYDVKVQAKNQLLEVTQATGTSCLAEDSPIIYGVSATVPAPDAEIGIERIELYIPLPAEVADLADSKVALTSSGAAAGDFDSLTDGAVRLDDADFNTQLVTNSPKNAHLELTTRGLEKLAAIRDGNPDARITWQFQVTPTATIDIITTAYLLPAGYPEFEAGQTYGVASNEVKLHVCQPEITPESTPVPVPVPTPDLPKDLFPGLPAESIEAQISASKTSQQSETPSSGVKKFIEDLASTGANVQWIVIAGLAAIALGVLMQRRRDDGE